MKQPTEEDVEKVRGTMLPVMVLSAMIAGAAVLGVTSSLLQGRFTGGVFAITVLGVAAIGVLLWAIFSTEKLLGDGQ